MQTRARFEPVASSVGAARRFVGDALVAEGRGEYVGPVTLVVSELASNAVLHAGSAFEVDLRVDRDVHVGVTDTGPGVPRLRTVGVEARNGRGLAIVDAICTSWGVDAGVEGKRVWCSVGGDAPAAAGATAVGEARVGPS